MTGRIERIKRVGSLAWYGYSRYVQEVEKSKFETNEASTVVYYNSVEMPDGLGTRVNILI